MQTVPIQSTYRRTASRLSDVTYLGQPLANEDLARREYARDVTVVNTLPSIVTLALTTHCYTRGICVICDRQQRDFSADRETDEHVIQAARPLLETATSVLLHCGGEAMFSRHFDSVIRMLRPPTRVSFATNGMALTEARADLMLDAGVMGEFVVSLDASTSQIFQLMRPACDFETVVRNVRYYTSRASELPSDARRGVTLNMTVCEANLGDVPGLVDLAADVGARRVHYNHLNEGLTHSVEAPDGTKWSYAEQKNFRAPQLHDELVLEAYRRGERQGISVTFIGEPFLVRRGNDIASARRALRNYDHTVPLKVWSEPWHSPSHQPKAPGVPICHKPWKEVVIQPGGEVRRCYFHDETRFTLGNVTGGDFMALWNSEAMIREREEFLSHSTSQICGQSMPCLHRSRR